MKRITSTVLLRIAAVIMLIHSIAHGAAIISWQNPDSDVPATLVHEMQSTHFLVRGKLTTMAESFTGGGYSVTSFLLLISLILWAFSKREGRDAQLILLLTGSALVVLAVIEFLFFFPAPAIITSVSALFIFIALFQLKQKAILIPKRLFL